MAFLWSSAKPVDESAVGKSLGSPSSRWWRGWLQNGHQFCAQGQGNKKSCQFWENFISLTFQTILWDQAHLSLWSRHHGAHDYPDYFIAANVKIFVKIKTVLHQGGLAVPKRMNFRKSSLDPLPTSQKKCGLLAKRQRLCTEKIGKIISSNWMTPPLLTTFQKFIHFVIARPRLVSY